MELTNSTHLDTDRLARMFAGVVQDWPHDQVRVSVRYSRKSAFSGVCFYQSGRININLGRRNRYPFEIKTHVAKAQSDETKWWRELYSIQARDEYELTLFIFLHEFYHWLVRQARRNVRQKESRCDRFAVRWMVDRYGASVRDARGRLVPRAEWDFQDVEGFVATARRQVHDRPVRKAVGFRRQVRQLELFSGTAPDMA